MDETKLSKYAAKKLRQAREAEKEAKAKGEYAKDEEQKAPRVPAATDVPPKPKKPNADSVRASKTAIAEALAKKSNAAIWEDARHDLAEAQASVHRVAVSMAVLLPTVSGAFYGEVSGVLGIAHSLEERITALVRRLDTAK